MKRLLLLTAIITAVSTFTYADNFEDIKFKSEYGKGNTDDSKLEYTHIVNELSGTLSLDDEMEGLKFNFNATRHDFLNPSDDFGGSIWDTDFNFMKPYKLGSKDLEFMLGFKYGNADGIAIGYLDGLIPVKLRDGHGYEAYFGTAIPFKIFGQHGEVTPRIVYYNDQGTYTRDYKDQGTAGWGGDFDIEVGGPIVSGKYGGLSYGVALNNHWRKASDTKETFLMEIIQFI